MTNKGQKFLQGELDKSKARCIDLDRTSQEQHQHILGLKQAINAMEHDLVRLAECSFITSMFRLARLRRELKRRIKAQLNAQAAYNVQQQAQAQAHHDQPAAAQS